jgi:ribosomal protein S18 acetylase RimI-like enzyme
LTDALRCLLIVSSLAVLLVDLYHALTWPQLSYVAEEASTGKIVGYILAKMFVPFLLLPLSLLLAHLLYPPTPVSLSTASRDDDAATSTTGPPKGHVTSISVLRTHRRLGLANKLMRQSQEAMATVYRAEYCSLHVRKTNRAAISLYRDSLGFKVHDVEVGYCEFSLFRSFPCSARDLRWVGRFSTTKEVVGQEQGRGVFAERWC